MPSHPPYLQIRTGHRFSLPQTVRINRGLAATHTLEHSTDLRPSSYLQSISPSGVGCGLDSGRSPGRRTGRCTVPTQKQSKAAARRMGRNPAHSRPAIGVTLRSPRGTNPFQSQCLAAVRSSFTHQVQTLPKSGSVFRIGFSNSETPKTQNGARPMATPSQWCVYHRKPRHEARRGLT